MTEEEFLALPDDGVERWLVGGEVKEWGTPTRNIFDSQAMARVAQKLANWCDAQPKPRGKVYVGDACFLLAGDPELTLGIDAAYVAPDRVAEIPANSRVVRVPPTLVVEILSPSDTQDDIHEKIDTYISHGAAAVWTLDTVRRTVIVYRPDEEPKLFNSKQELTGDAILPGFRVPVAELFE